MRRTPAPLRRLLRAKAGVVIALLAVGCATGPEYDPFKVPRGDLRRRVQTIALLPLSADGYWVDRDRVAEDLEPLIRNRLEDGGFRVVGSDAVREVLHQASADVGGLYDPETGDVIEDRVAPMQSAVHRELRRLHDVDAILSTRIETVELLLTYRKIHYCGRKDDEIYWPGDLGIFTQTTSVLVLCLSTTLRDTESRVLYGIRHGLEPLATYHRQTRALRPRDERLRDSSRLATAVDETLAPLATLQGD
jgi:hypothetical protein